MPLSRKRNKDRMRLIRERKVRQSVQPMCNLATTEPVQPKPVETTKFHPYPK